MQGAAKRPGRHNTATGEPPTLAGMVAVKRPGSSMGSSPDKVYTRLPAEQHRDKADDEHHQRYAEQCDFH